MRSLLGPEHYLSPEIHAREQERIFRRLWIFAGFRTLLSKPDEFVTLRVGGKPIVVQNCSGALRAFVNQCAHRQGAVQIDDHGQRRLVCPYHGWVYAEDGKVRSIPGCDGIYGFSPDSVAGLHLTPVALQCIGNVVFVNLDANPMPIEAQFHEAFLTRLEEVSGYLDNEALFASFRGGYNWKLNFENVVDWNHVPYVHSRSFAPLMPGMRAVAAEPAQPTAPPVPDSEIGDDLRDLSYEMQAPFTNRHWPWHDWVDRFTQDDIYFNFFLYPNVNFISMAGVIFLAQQFNPVAPSETDVRLTMTTGRKRRRIPALPAILWGHMKSEKHVIDEDIVVLEGLQRGLDVGVAHAMQGSYEFRLRRIAKTYRRLIGESVT